LIQFEDPAALNQLDGWYRHLYDKMICPLDTFGNNAIAIVSFNYDRSLEEFFFRSISNVIGYGRTDEEIASVFEKDTVCTSSRHTGTLAMAGSQWAEVLRNWPL
jgi:hypothetical protein